MNKFDGESVLIKIYFLDGFVKYCKLVLKDVIEKGGKNRQV